MVFTAPLIRLARVPFGGFAGPGVPGLLQDLLHRRQDGAQGVLRQPSGFPRARVVERIGSMDAPKAVSLIAIHDRRARIAQDPSPRQYCVKQGWLARQGEMAVCLPNQVSLELAGAKKLYDTLSY